MATHLDLAVNVLGIAITRTDQPADDQPLATITETLIDGVRSYTLELPGETIAGQDDAIGAAAYHAIRDRIHDLAAEHVEYHGLYESPWRPVTDGTTVYCIDRAEVWHPFVRAWE